MPVDLIMRSSSYDIQIYDNHPVTDAKMQHIIDIVIHHYSLQLILDKLIIVIIIYTYYFLSVGWLCA